MRVLLLSAACLLFLAGCVSHTITDAPGMLVIPGVPAFAGQQRTDDCASVALASLLAHAGHPASPIEIDQAVYDTKLKGSLLLDLENFAARRGAITHSGRGDLALLRQQLEQGRPLLLPIDLGWGLWRRPHYVVVFGYDKEHFLLHLRSGESPVIAAEKLEQQWSRAGHLYLYLD